MAKAGPTSAETNNIVNKGWQTNGSHTMKKEKTETKTKTKTKTKKQQSCTITKTKKASLNETCFVSRRRDSLQLTRPKGTTRDRHGGEKRLGKQKSKPQ